MKAHGVGEAEDSGTVGANQRSNRTKGSESVELELSGGFFGKSVLLSWLNDEKESKRAGKPSLVTRPQNQGKKSYVIKEGRDNHLPFWR